jgi:hypothetical protein
MMFGGLEGAFFGDEEIFEVDSGKLADVEVFALSSEFVGECECEFGVVGLLGLGECLFCLVTDSRVCDVEKMMMGVEAR